MSSSSVDRMSGASTPTLLAMTSYTTNRLNEELSGLKRWRQMYDSAMNEKNEELQKLQLINQRQAQSLNDSVVQIEQQTMTINSMKQNEVSLEKKVTKLEEVHHVVKKNVAKLEKAVSQCQFVRVDLERMYEHQERTVKSLADRVNSTIETKLQNLQSQLKLVEQLHEQARIELNKQIYERTQENSETTSHIWELTTKLAATTNEINQLQTINTNTNSKIIELTEEINKYQQMIELISIENNTVLTSKNQQIEDLQKRIDTLALKIDAGKDEAFNLHELNTTLQTQIDEMKQKSVEHTQYHQTEVQARQVEIDIREKENEQLQIKTNQLIEEMATRSNEIEAFKEKNQVLLNEINEMNLNLRKQLEETREQFHQQISDYAKQSTEYDNRFEKQTVEMTEKEKLIYELENKHNELVEKMELTEEEITQLTKENEDLRTENHLLLQETDEQMKQKDVIVEATNIEIGEKEKEIEELQKKVTLLEERLSKNQNLLTSLRSSMGEKDAKIKRLEQGSVSSQSSLPSRATNILRTNINHPLATQQKSATPIRPPLPPSTSQQAKINTREKRMLPPPAANDFTSTPKKILRLSQTKAAIDHVHTLEQSISSVLDDDRDEVASNTSVASLFEYLKKI
ncbi:unnamed protein product [Rotaria magnacalcarata]|uniref:Uncharacterized protein n=7 Tax=Rotaria magnacalcarata TaxID=392030 RepID=A0A819HKN7_9BILA|nr:unnamed protein product [Rotaria magnacalcarata]CAF3902458.1 unnamed protein product [Rotaria magnacalcarata]